MDGMLPVHRRFHGLVFSVVGHVEPAALKEPDEAWNSRFLLGPPRPLSRALIKRNVGRLSHTKPSVAAACALHY